MMEMVVRLAPTHSKFSDRNSHNDNKLLLFGKGFLLVKALISLGYKSHHASMKILSSPLKISITVISLKSTIFDNLFIFIKLFIQFQKTSDTY